MSWKPEVQTDNTGKWYGNALRFNTKQEALDNAADIALGEGWFTVKAYRATECTDPVNYQYVNHELKEVK